jgi:hypothetical protein
MGYVQGEVREDFACADDLIRAIRSRPRTVRFDADVALGDTWSGRISDLPAGTTVTIWGPHRLWKVNVSRGPGGFVVTASSVA